MQITIDIGAETESEIADLIIQRAAEILLAKAVDDIGPTSMQLNISTLLQANLREAQRDASGEIMRRIIRALQEGEDALQDEGDRIANPLSPPVDPALSPRRVARDLRR
jgi:hypothetical protein